jgi:hypothetical protein
MKFLFPPHECVAWLRVSNAAAIIALNAMNTLADNGGHIKVWTGSAPGTCADLILMQVVF